MGCRPCSSGIDLFLESFQCEWQKQTQSSFLTKGNTLVHVPRYRKHLNFSHSWSQGLKWGYVYPVFSSSLKQAHAAWRSDGLPQRPSYPTSLSTPIGWVFSDSPRKNVPGRTLLGLAWVLRWFLNEGDVGTWVRLFSCCEEMPRSTGPHRRGPSEERGNITV